MTQGTEEGRKKRASLSVYHPRRKRETGKKSMVESHWEPQVCSSLCPNRTSMQKKKKKWCGGINSG